MIVRPSFRRCLGLLRIWDRALLEVAPRRPPLGLPPAPRRPRGLARAASSQPARAVSGRVGGGGSLPSRGCLGSGRGRLRGPSGFSPERPPSGFGSRGPRGCRAARPGFVLFCLGLSLRARLSVEAPILVTLSRFTRPPSCARFAPSPAGPGRTLRAGPPWLAVPNLRSCGAGAGALCGG